jgi:L-fuconolactonase
MDIRIDTHQHYWKLGLFNYSWLTPELSTLYRDFLPADLTPSMNKAGISKSIVVQADNSVEETSWLLELAGKNTYINGIVAWIDIKDPNFAHQLQEYKKYPTICGVRPDAPKTTFDVEETIDKFQLLGELKLTCDLLCNNDILPFINQLVEKCTQTIFIIDHLGGLPVVPEGQHAWKESLRPLSEYPNVNLKLSGYLGYAKPRPPTIDFLLPFFESAIELFSANRLMYGSDWPVCTLGGPYELTTYLLNPFLQQLSLDDQSAIWSGTAQKIYLKEGLI